MQTSKVTIAILIPLLTLVLGWQLGTQYELHRVRDLEQRLSVLYGEDTTGSGAVLTDPEKEVRLDLFWGVWRLLQKHYIAADEMQSQKMLYGAVSGLVASLEDPYTVFMTPKENTDFRESLSGHLEGIGAELAIRGGDVVVVAPLKGSPAEKSGLLPEDVITDVDGATIVGLPLQAVVAKIRGEKGTTVELTVYREGRTAPLKLKITRDTIQVPSVAYEERKTATGSVGILTIHQFGSETISEVTAALKDINPEELRGLIIDLRFNGGGYLEASIELTSMFLKEGKVVSVERRNAEPQRHYVSGDPAFPLIPLAVLINQGSASASEIVAGALQDHHRATIVGMKSFGKGTVQEVLDLPGGSSLRVTTARWLTPSGRDLGKEGVLPDEEVDRTVEQMQAGEDPQLERALEILTEGVPTS